MSTSQVQRTINFAGGLYTGTGRFNQPQGTIPRGSNLIWLRRGAMRVTDGTLVLSSLNGGGPTDAQSPFRWIGRYALSGTAASTYALQVGGAKVNLIDVSGTSYSTPAESYTSGYPTPSFVQAENYLAIALGYNVVPHLFNNGTTAPITNSWFGISKISAWSINAAITQGTPIVPTVDNGFVYVALNNGMTGGTQPSWPLGVGSTVQDASVLWQLVGPTAPPVPPGAQFIFYHGSFLFLWGTSASYLADGINGPDTLQQSDSLNFNSWNPLNSTFVGKGDGTLPRGGGVMTLSEAGISATAQLVLFKDVDTYTFLGFFPNWSLTKATNGVGCYAPGSVQFVADVGLMRLSYRGVAVFDGQNDHVDEYTDPIREYLFGSDEKGITQIDWANAGLSMAAQQDNPRMYLLAVPLVGGGGALTRIFGYDVRLRAWTTPIDLPWGISALAYLPQNPLIQRTLFGGASDGTIQAYANNSSSTWAGTLVSWGLRTPDIGDATSASYIRRLNVRGQSVANSQPYLTGATLNYQDREGVVRTKPLVPPSSTAVLTASLDVDETVLSANVDLTGVDRAILEGLGYQSTPKPPARIGGGQQIEQLSQVVTVIYQAGGSVTVGAGATFVTVLLPTTAPNANYQVTVTPNWMTTFDFGNKTIVQFTVYFNTPAPAGGIGSIDWTAQIFQ